MNEVEMMLGIRPNPDAAGWIVTKRLIQYEGGESRFGPLVETRVGSRAPGEPTLEDAPPSEGIVVHDRAWPIFGSLTEAERRAVLEAVNRLRGLGRGQWAAAGLRLLPPNPLAFGVLEVGEFSAFVSPAEGGGVEIRDLVRTAVLAQFRPREDGQGAGP